ncbi:DNA polymerase III PolC-type [Clostridium tepidiprofundi DSM 19306]|uniref:DNA polymerase III PolC-type n=1 Tax=Clostridium tepidiprofundi DSM 19306 TaxID=1121338 RepID=A0A151B821_9CLOT|nr:PolC-type DNA polymerase III [Clostridium tepidiprofundi]KYH35797.1 DNA polymerase III PolC-type [Clostridium tepidiprofundi DSM 19306]
MSSNIIQLLTSNIDEANINELNDVKLIKVQYFRSNNKLLLILRSRKEISKGNLEIIKKAISKRLSIISEIEIICYKDINSVTIEQIIDQYWNDVVTAMSKIMPVCKECLNNSKKEIHNNTILIHYSNQFVVNILHDKGLEKHLSIIIKDIFDIECVVKLLYSPNIKSFDYFKCKDKENKSIIKQVLNETAIDINNKRATNSTSVTNKNSYYKNKKVINNKNENTNCIMGKSINQDTISMIDVNETSGIVSIKGEIFKLDIKDTKTGKKIVIFDITDYTSSLTVKCFPKAQEIEKVLENISVGLYCKVRGEAMLDTYTKELVVLARDIMKLKKIEKMDTSYEKRVELHMHTQMSAMDAVTSATKLIERAAKWGHKAVAITDHGVAQAYPEAMKAAKKYNIKVIYGVEGYFVDDGEPIAILDNDSTLEDSFVVFDLETTGFSSENNKIIEIGAVKIKNGEIIDRFSELVTPKENIPYTITELTGITNSMVKDCRTISDILPEFMEFSKGAVLVAHNASFDISFIKKNCEKLKIDFKASILDTIPLCKFVYPELKKYKLNIVAKHLNISLENHHRAVDDAKATAEILLNCFQKLKEKNIKTLSQLNDEYLGKFDVKKANTYHIIILAKNQVGLKNLYKLISESNLKYFNKRPRMPKSLINKYRDGLIIGSACEAGQIYKKVLSGKSYDELKEIIDFYDYLEIQPLGNNKFMIEKGIVKDIDELKHINKKICDLGERANKPVVATCDVHFMDPNDEVFRRIIMAGKGFSDADEQPPLYFRTTNEMLEEFDYLGEEKANEVVIQNTQKIADMIDEVKPIPDETFPPIIDGAEEEIKKMTWEKAHNIYGENLPEIVEKRLQKELDSIIGNGYAVLYLIAHKLVAKSYNDGYLVGSRGSVGSSFAATMANITEVNGLPPHYICSKCKYSEFILDGSAGAGVDLPDKTCPQCGNLMDKDGFDIPFATFLGFEGDKEPDIDLNFSGDNQADIHRYTEVLFGKGHTFKAGTIGTIAEKTAYGFVKKYLDERNITATRAEIDRLTMGCTGIKRTTGQHPGGIMVVPADNEIYNFCPIQHPADDPNSEIITTHFDYHSISGRLLKLDILGHDDPTVLRMLKDITGIDPRTVPLGDKKVLSLFRSPEALGVTAEELGCEVGTYGLPEFGTKFVRQMLLDTKPNTFSDLVRISGLSHGTDVWINNAQYYIKEGYTTLKDCIATRDDIMMYLIYKGVEPKIAFTIMEKVRKGKGLTEEQENLMREHNVPDWYIESCKKIKYMFPKGHAVAYVMMAIRIAYFKVYYPEAYYSVYFTVRADEFDGDLIAKGDEAVMAKLKELNQAGNSITNKEKGLITTLEICHEMFLRGIKFLKADLYKSHANHFKIEKEGIRLPLSALEGVGENAAKSIVAARTSGEFLSKEDLRNRAKVPKTVIESLDKHGCLYGLPETNQLSFL